MSDLLKSLTNPAGSGPAVSLCFTAKKEIIRLQSQLDTARGEVELLKFRLTNPYKTNERLQIRNDRLLRVLSELCRLKEIKSKLGYTDQYVLCKPMVKISESFEELRLMYLSMQGEVERYKGIHDGLVEYVRDLMSGSVGVAGWHQNGDVAYWSEFSLLHQLQTDKEVSGE